MKSLVKLFAMHLAFAITSLSAFSQTTENFNSRPGLDTVQTLDYLQDHCWQFSNFAILTNGVIEGDGSLISTGAGASNIYTPVLNMWGDFTLSFKYSFQATATESRSINIYLTNANNEVVSLADNIDVTNAAANTVYTYNKQLPAGSSVYKLLISYQGGTNLPLIAIDNVLISANQRYATGCNEAPIAGSDMITGDENRQASGYVTGNDVDPNGEALATYLISDSRDGKVTLGLNGYFTFTPNPDFTGTYTAFTYQVCDYGYNPLCSQPATVMISFPNTLPVHTTDLQANFVNNAVTIKWVTSSESNSDRFEIERSTDGSNFEKAGAVKAAGNSSVKLAYVYQDKVSETFTRKNDLFYRLKQIDRDGRSNYSKVLLVRVFRSKTLETVSVTPNPAVNDIKVHMQLNEHAYVVIRLRTISGEEVIRKTIKGLKGENSFTLEGSDRVKKGVYMLEVIVNSNERMLVKLIKN